VTRPNHHLDAEKLAAHYGLGDSEQVDILANLVWLVGEAVDQCTRGLAVDVEQDLVDLVRRLCWDRRVKDPTPPPEDRQP